MPDDGSDLMVGTPCLCQLTCGAVAKAMLAVFFQANSLIDFENFSELDHSAPGARICQTGCSEGFAGALREEAPANWQ